MGDAPDSVRSQLANQQTHAQHDAKSYQILYVTDGKRKMGLDREEIENTDIEISEKVVCPPDIF